MKLEKSVSLKSSVKSCIIFIKIIQCIIFKIIHIIKNIISILYTLFLIFEFLCFLFIRYNIIIIINNTNAIIPPYLNKKCDISSKSIKNKLFAVSILICNYNHWMSYYLWTYFVALSIFLNYFLNTFFRILRASYCFMYTWIKCFTNTWYFMYIIFF